MQHSPAPKSELDKAGVFIVEMERAKSLDEFEEAWKGFLFRLERCFNKAHAHFKKSPKWDCWWGKYKQLRKNDELLSYLINARGAEEHSVEQIVERHAGGIGINPAAGKSLYIEKMTLDDSGNVSILSPQKLAVVFIPERMTLLPIMNRGVMYPVPRFHLGLAINSADVCGIAKLAHVFYSKFLSSAEEYFVK
ncbi:Aminotran_1_2 domain-containing protein [Pseudomonas chlororaphis]|uniref:hypothetical protein n=1 Tax=Pseudomonas chlororaphis TaxID=587753 RepID=UPI0039E152B4